MHQPVDLLERLADLPPGAELSAALAGLVLAGVPNDRVVDVLAAQHRQLAHEQARMLATIVEVSRTTPFSAGEAGEDRRDRVHRAASAHEWAGGELAAALTWTAGAAYWELSFAETVVCTLPQVFAALWDGRIDRAKAKVFADHLDPAYREHTEAQVDAICSRLVPLAPGLTCRQLAGRLLRMLIAIDPGHARRRYRRAVRDRGVSLYLDRDGTAALTGEGLPPDEAAAACERLDRLAAAAKRAGHPGLLAQITADLYLGMLDGRYHALTEDQIITCLLLDPRSEDTPETVEGAQVETDEASAATEGGETRGGGEGADNAPGAPGAAADAGPEGDAASAAATARSGADAGCGAAGGADAAATAPVGVRQGFEVRVGLGTLLGLDEQPGEIPGLGPVLADVARTAVAAQRRGAEWRFAVTDPLGYLILAGVTRRRPRRGREQAADAADGAGRCRGGIVELHLPAALLEHLARDAAGCGEWAGVVADIAAQYARRDQLIATLDTHPAARFARAALARHVQVRDRTCTHPGCGRPARKSDLDHTRDHTDGGPSIAGNLGPDCARHHTFKHELGWRLRQPEPGIFEWTSPLGRVYRTRGEPITPALPEPRPRPPEPDDAGDTRIRVDVPRGRTRPAPQPSRPPPPTTPDPDEPPPF